MHSIFFSLESLLYFNFYFIFISLIITLIVYYFKQYWNSYSIQPDFTTFKYLKFTILTSLGVSFIFHLITLYLYVTYSNILNNSVLVDLPIFIPYLGVKWSFYIFSFSIDFFGLIILLLAYLIGFISIYVLDTRISARNIKYLFSFNIFIIIVYLYTTTTNIVLLFIFYEFLLLPSFLFVYYISPSRRAIQASVYFVVWTQIGSLIVLIAISYLIKVTSLYDMNYIRLFIFSPVEAYIIYILLFIGFGVKVPIWPFHYWLTKTHVEAPSGFSIYLSGFLVKTAIYGFYKITTLLNIYINTTFFITICVMGIIDSSLKMWGQTDLKKLVAYGTIQEMNIIFLVFCWGDSTIIGSGILFCITHAFLSALMFYLVDCLYRRYHTRSLIEINGLLHTVPNISIGILFMIIFFAGLPGTLKFSVEFYIFSSLLTISPFLTIMLMFIANVVGLVGFSKCWFNAVFGLNKKWLSSPIVDATWRELFVILNCFFFLVIFTFSPLYLF